MSAINPLAAQQANGQPWANSSPTCCLITPEKQFPLFCVGCSVAVCTNCTPGHLSHELVTIEAGANLLKKRLDEMIASQRRDVLEVTPRNMLMGLRQECMQESEQLRQIHKKLHTTLEESFRSIHERVVACVKSTLEYITDKDVAPEARQLLLNDLDNALVGPTYGNPLEAAINYSVKIRRLWKSFSVWYESVRTFCPHFHIDRSPADEVFKAIQDLFTKPFVYFGDDDPVANNGASHSVEDGNVAAVAKDKKRRRDAFPPPPKRSSVETQSLTLSRAIGGNSISESTHTALLTCPKAFTIDEAGFIIVADAGHHRIQVYRSDGTFHFSFGFPGACSGTLNSPFKIVVVKDPKEPSGDAYVIADHSIPADPAWLNDRCNSKIAPDHYGRVQIFSRDGIYRRKVTIPDVVRITSLGSNGETFFIVDGEKNVVYAYEGISLVRTLCFNEAVGELSEICVFDNMVLACDYRRHRVAVMSLATERIVGTFGDGHLAYPNGIHVDVSAGVVFVADSHENYLRVSVFTLGTWEFSKALVYKPDKVSHVVGIKQVPATKELVVLNRPGKSIRVFAGFVLVFLPPPADTIASIFNSCMAMPLNSLVPNQMLPAPLEAERFVRRTQSAQPTRPQATLMIWDEPEPMMAPTGVLLEINSNQENSGGDRPHKRKSSTKKFPLKAENGDVNMLSDNPSPPRMSRRSLGFDFSQESSGSSSQVSVNEAIFQASLSAWEFGTARSSQ